MVVGVGEVLIAIDVGAETPMQSPNGEMRMPAATTCLSHESYYCRRPLLHSPGIYTVESTLRRVLYSVPRAVVLSDDIKCTGLVDTWYSR